MNQPVWDTDYGNYSSLPSDYHWSDLFQPHKTARKKATEDYRLGVQQLLDEIADENGLDSTEWGREDYEIFMEKMDII